MFSSCPDRSGEFKISPRRACPKSCTVKLLPFLSPQSELYPKECIRTFLNLGSKGNHCCGQYWFISSVLLHVLRDPPRRPCTKMKSMRGSEGAYSRFRPRGPRTSSTCSDCRRPRLRPGNDLLNNDDAVVDLRRNGSVKAIDLSLSLLSSTLLKGHRGTFEVIVARLLPCPLVLAPPSLAR